MILSVKKTIKEIFPEFLLNKLINYYRIFKYLNDYFTFRKLNDKRFCVHFKDRRICTGDASANTGFDSHYVYHTAWAARILAQTETKEHYDIGSCLRFITIVSAFVPLKYYDLRPADLHLPNLSSAHADITNLPLKSGSVKSLSCMHVIEHIGLGRYGDPLDPEGDIKASGELSRVLANGGQLLIAVPVTGRPRIEFNAHRVYSYDRVIELFPGLKLKSFALIPDHAGQTGLIEDARRDLVNQQRYACGCFWFVKEACVCDKD